MYENAPKTKLVILGDSSVGKSCILNRLKFNFFNENIESTVGCEFFAKEMEVNNYLSVLDIRKKLIISNFRVKNTF